MLFMILPRNNADPLTWKKPYIEHGRRFDGKQVPTSGRGKKERILQNRVYKHGKLLLSR